MEWETFPIWFWLLYYSFLLSTYFVALNSIFYKKLVVLSAIAIFFAFTVPAISILSSVDRVTGNEYDFLISQLKDGHIWPLYALMGYFYIFFWWGAFVLEKVKQQQKETIIIAKSYPMKLKKIS